MRRRVAAWALAAATMPGTSALAVEGPGKASAPAEPGYVTVAEGVRLRVVDAGDRASRTTILFIPGWGTSSAIWREEMARWGLRARVVSVDPRSQGESTVTTHSNTPEQRARDLREVIAALGLTRVVLVGWSQGVQDAAAYAGAFRGQDIAGYVLVDATVSAGPRAAVQQPERLAQQLSRFALYQRYPRQYLRGMMEAIIRSPAGRGRIDELVDIGMHTPPELGTSMLVMDFLAVDRQQALASFDRPTLVVAASDSDELEGLREMSRKIAGARFETIDGAGHAVFLDQPARFHELLDRFVHSLGD